MRRSISRRLAGRNSPRGCDPARRAARLEILEARRPLTIAASLAEVDLVSDQSGVALIQDPHLVAPQGIALDSAKGGFWIADHAAGVATIYRGDVGGSPFVRDPLVVSIPGGAPTGVVANATTGFPLGGSALASFIFDAANGQLAAWNADVPPPAPSSAAQTVATKPSAVYTSLAQLSNAQGSFLLAANFHAGQIDVFDDHFAPAALTGDWVDPDLPAGYAPFSLAVMNGRLYVAYAKQDAAAQNAVPGAGDGVVAVFDESGTFQTQLIGAGANSPLNAPYGMAIAPSGFAGLDGDLLVANSGDGRLNAFDPATGAFLGALNNTQGEALAIDGVRSLAFGDGVSGDSGSLYFTADPAGGQHGLFGKLVDAQSSPLAVVGANISATEGAAFSGAVAALSDSNPNAQASGFTINIDWGDGTASPGALAANGNGGFNVVGSHTYAEDSATRRLSVTVTDPSGHTATALSQASVAENDLAVSGATIAAKEGAAHGFSGAVATFVDPGGSDAASAYTASVDWGDGSVSAGSIVSSSGRFTVLSNHEYADEGTFTLSVRVSEAGVNPTVGGASVSTVVVADADEMTASGATLSGVEGQTVGGAVATFIDSANSLAAAGEFTALIDWGDGTNPTTGNLSDSDGTFTVSGSHAYAEQAGPYHISTALSEDGSSPSSWTAAGAAAISDADRFVGAALSINATEGHALNDVSVATFTDANLATTAGDLTATIDWGDGTSAAGQVTGSNGDFTVAGSHTYADDGAYAVSVSLSEASPGTAAGSVTGAANVAEADFTAVSQTLSATEGALATLTQVFSDPDSADLPSDMKALVSWGDGANASSATLNGSGGQFTITAQHRYADEGQFSGQIAIVEGVGSSALAVGAIPLAAKVADADALTATPASLSAVEGAVTSLAVATFTDGNAAASAADFTATIDWGDGSSASAGSITLADGVFTVSGSHAFADEGTLSVGVSLAEDSSLPMASVTSTAAVADSDVLSPQGHPLSATEGIAFSGPAATFSDNNTAAVAGDFSATIDWGDGATSAGTVTGAHGQFTVSGAHAYSHDGSFSVQATIAESGSFSGIATATATSSATVGEGSDFSAAIAPSLAGAEQQTLSGVVATFDDAGSSDPPSQFSATIDWGDNTSLSAGSISGSAGHYSVLGSHQYNDEGSFPIQVAIVSATGSTISASGAAAIAEGDVLAGQGASLSPTVSAAFNGAVATFTDTNPASRAADFTAAIDWGDGTSAAAGVVTGGNGVFTVSGSHAYSQGGAQPIKTTFTEKTPGHAVATAIANATIAASSLSLVGVPVVVKQGTLAADVTLARFSGSPGGSGVDQFTASIDWGDGASSAGTVAASTLDNGFTVIGSHSYQGAGMRDIEVTVRGPGGVVQQVATKATVGSATEIFVSQAYRDLLHREPDAQGLQYWSQQIDGGGSRAAAVLGIERSGEYRLAEIQGLYQRYLHREADPAGLGADEAYLGNGGTPEQLAAAIVSSPEYFRTRGGGTNHGFLQALYADALFRAADQAAMQSYANQDFRVETAPVQAVDAVFNSREFYEDLVSAPGSAASSKFAGWTAYGWYQAFLNRNPASASVSYYASALADGDRDDAVIAAIIGSQEYSTASLTRVDSLQP